MRQSSKLSSISFVIRGNVSFPPGTLWNSPELPNPPESPVPNSVKMLLSILRTVSVSLRSWRAIKSKKFWLELWLEKRLEILF